MRSFFLPEGNALTDQQFTQSALESPLSGWRTAGFAARDVAEQSVLGTIVRRAETPALAGHYEDQQGFGRFGTKRWVPDTPEQAEARGEKLFSSADEYKASPYFRDNVPFEPGMTENRARALAEQNDARAIRDYYMQKRPVASFLGGVGGALLAPENFVPVLGEAAGAATSARIGKLASRIVLGGGDAALNTGLFQVLTASERAKLGDDTSWQAIGENMAYAAVAGALFGGVLGGAEKLRGRYLTPDLNARPAPASEAPAGVPRETSGLTMGETVGVSFGDRWNATIADAVETPTARAKAAAILNDAMTGLAMDGEVRLGEQTKAHLAELRAEADRLKGAWDRVRGNPNGPVNDPLVHITPKDIEGLLVQRGAFKNINELEFSKRGHGLVKIIWRHGPESDKPPELQVSQTDITALPKVVRNFEPSSVSADGLRREWRVMLPDKKFGKRPVFFADTMMPDGNRHLVTAYIPEIASPDRQKPMSAKRKPAATGSRPQAVNLVGDTATGPFDRTPGGQSLPADGNIASNDIFANSSDNYAVPAPDPVPPQLEAAYKVVDGNPKPKAPDAAITKAIDDAKAEGLDPETGGHDLEEEIKALQDQGFELTADEQAALTAADETYQAVSAWEKVMNVARSCVLK